MKMYNYRSDLKNLQVKQKKLNRYSLGDSNGIGTHNH